MWWGWTREKLLCQSQPEDSYFPRITKVVKYGHSVAEKVRVCQISFIVLGLVRRWSGWMAICFCAEKPKYQHILCIWGSEKAFLLQFILLHSGVSCLLAHQRNCVYLCVQHSTCGTHLLLAELYVYLKLWVLAAGDSSMAYILLCRNHSWLLTPQLTALHKLLARVIILNRSYLWFKAAEVSN